MKKKIFISIVIMILLSAMMGIAYADVPSGLSLSCDAAILIDASTGSIVFEYNSDNEMPVASVNKIMTLFLAFKSIEDGRISLEDSVTISHNASSMGGSQVYLETGGHYSVHELLKSIVVASANDSCVALGEHIAGSEQSFVDLMNQTATELGLSSSLYANCTGLPDDNHYMSTRDIATLSRRLLEYELFFTYSTIWTEHFQHPSGRTTLITNTNKLTQYYTGCDGIKTGFTNEAMYCLSATASKGDTRLIAVVLGEPSSSIRNNDIAEMFNYGFANYTTRVIYKKGDTIVEDIRVLGADDTLTNAIAGDDICIFVDKSKQDDITSTINIDTEIVAPIEKGNTIGSVEIFVDNILASQSDIVINRDIQKMTFGGCLSRIIEIYDQSYYK